MVSLSLTTKLSSIRHPPLQSMSRLPPFLCSCQLNHLFNSSLSLYLSPLHMAMASICCRSASPPLPRSSSPGPANSTKSLWTVNEGSWRRRSVLGVASLGIAFEFVDLAGGRAAAIEEAYPTADSKYEKGVRWSEKRTCPQWRRNSLETIVPENLPRPFSRRGRESMGFPKSAPAVEALVVDTTQSQCFTM